MIITLTLTTALPPVAGSLLFAHRLWVHKTLKSGGGAPLAGGPQCQDIKMAAGAVGQGVNWSCAQQWLHSWTLWTSLGLGIRVWNRQCAGS